MIKSFGLILVFLLLNACSNVTPDPQYDMKTLKQLEIAAPVANKVEHTESHHGKTLSDPYNWLKDPSYPEVNDKSVLDYLQQENSYYQAFLEPHKALVDTLFEEFKGRTNEQEVSVPWIEKGFEYQWYYQPGAEYKTYSRKQLGSGEEEVFLDLPELAKGYDYFDLQDWAISPDDRYLAYSTNTNGDERFEIHIRDLRSGKLLSDTLSNTDGSIVFSADSQSILYAKLDDQRWIARTINMHRIGTEQASDQVLFEEKDQGMFLGMAETSSLQYLLIYSVQGEVHEIHAVALDAPESELKLLASRDHKFKYTVDHANGFFYILANDTHKNFRLAKVAQEQPEYNNWQTIVAPSDSQYLLNFKTFSDFIALKARESGKEQLRIMDYQGNAHSVEFPEPIFTVDLGNNAEFSQSFVRLNYESMVTPDTVFDYHLDSKTLQTRKVKALPSGYDKEQYETKRIMAPSRDGEQIPVSIVYKKGYKQDGSHPLYLYAYGAYGISIDPSFSATRLSLLDRGFAFAIAHVRGGDMMGYQWYLDGKLDQRHNTFNDFIDVAKHLIEKNYVSKGEISIAGGSAGGELMGAAVVQAPQLWQSALLSVPFVDVLNTMLDASLPLTPPEWKEWGNPLEDPQAYELIAGYSPYDNISAQDYPPMMVTGGLNDPRVTYWEPAKFTAKMRALKTDKNLLVMRMNMGAGHFSNSGRYGRLRDYAEEYAFILLSHGIHD